MLESEETSLSNMDATAHGDALRCAQYNLMIEQLRIALDHTTSKLPYVKRKEIFDALDWYHTESLYARKDNDGKPVFVSNLPPGQWPTTTMEKKFALNNFKRIESIKWLKLKPYTPMKG